MRRQLRVWRRNNGNATIAGSGSASDAPRRISALGYENITVFMRVGGAATLAIWQGLRANGTMAITDVASLSGAGATSQVFNRTGEVVGFSFLNGATAQQPEIIAALA